MPEVKITGRVDITVQKILKLSDQEYDELMEQIEEANSDFAIDNILGEYADDLNDCCVDWTNNDFELYMNEGGKWKFVEEIEK
jgi:hypothetical protein